MKSLPFLAKLALLVLLSVPFLAGCGGGDPLAGLTPEQQTTLSSYQLIEQINNPDIPSASAKLFEMTYSADYAFDRYIQIGGSPEINFFNTHIYNQPKHAIPSPNTPFGCADFCGKNQDGHVIFGRNFDQTYNGVAVPILILHTKPANGYASLSVVYLPYLQNNQGEKSDILLTAPYYPIDGMNEAGLAVSVLYEPEEIAGTDPHKITIWHCCLLRLMLDYAKTVDEAITLLQSYNIDFGVNHMIVADRSGDSAVIESIQGQMKVIRSGKPWQVVTNYKLYGVDPEDLTQCWRYKAVWTYLKNTNGVISSTEGMALLGSISQDTYWSTIYDLESGEAQLACVKNYQRIKTFNLTMLH